ncbi:MAG: SDR family oxidoreductase [Desulfobacterales bacterium]
MAIQADDGRRTNLELQHVLVTGANGFIGRTLCRRMLAEGWHVRGAIRSLSQKAALPPGIDTVEIGSIGPSTEWDIALEGIDTVVHLAARAHVMGENSVDPNFDYRKINVDGTKHLAQIAQSKRVRRFVFVSSIKVNGEGSADPYTEADQPAPLDPYSISKFEAENELQSMADKTDLEVVILRPPLVYGPEVKANFLRLIKLINRGIPLPLAGVKNHRSMIFIENLVDALFICATHPRAVGNIFLVSDGIDISTPELIQKISSALGKPSRVFALPPGFLRLLGRATGKSGVVSRLCDSLIVDSTKIRTELDWKPPFSMQEGLRETVRWYQQAFRQGRLGRQSDR